MLAILVVANYLRVMQSNEPIEVRSKTVQPVIVELVLIGLTLCVSVLVLSNEVYQIYKNMKAKKKLKDSSKN